MADDDLEAAFQVFMVRGGRVLGRKGWVVDRVEELSRAELVASFVRQLYMERDEVPPRVLVPAEPADREVLEAWLGERRGAKVRIGVPERGAKRRLHEVVTSNAEESFHRHKLRRASDFGARSRALTELADRLGLEQAPAAHRVLRHLEPRPHRHRRLDGGLRGRTAEALGLPPIPYQGRARAGRFRFHGRDAAPPLLPPARGAGRGARRRGAGSPIHPRSSWSTAAGVSSAWRRRCSVSSGSQIPHIGLAKRLEEVYFPDHPEPLMIPRGSEALFVLQHLRDEAHRFAVTYHRQAAREAGAASRRSTTCRAWDRPARRPC